MYSRSNCLPRRVYLRQLRVAAVASWTIQCSPLRDLCAELGGFRQNHRLKAGASLGLCLILLFGAILPKAALAASPTAVDVFAAVKTSEARDPQSTRVVLVGADADFDALTYQIVSGPANGTLSDPAASDALITSGDLAGQSATYTPAEGFVGTDSFSYQVSDNTSSSSVKTATVRVYQYYLPIPSQLGTDITGLSAGDAAGVQAISANGRTLAVSGADIDGSNSRGNVRVLDFDDAQNAWVQRGQTFIGVEANVDATAASLSSDGQTLAIGARFDSCGPIGASGTVKIYDFDGSAWLQRGDTICGADNSWSGSTVVLSSDGQTVAFGAPFAIGTNGSGRPGHVRAFHYNDNGSTWVELGTAIEGVGEFDKMGSAISLSSDGYTLAVGSALYDGPQTNSGQVRVFDFVANAWAQRGTAIDGVLFNKGFAEEVALSGDGSTVAIGITEASPRFQSSVRGVVRVFRFGETDWENIGQDVVSSVEFAYTGRSLALSADGATMAVGSSPVQQIIGNSGELLNDARGNAGVYHYSEVGDFWIKRSVDIVGESAEELSSSTVALSEDGLTLAIGAPGNDENGDNAGTVRVFDLTEDSPLAGFVVEDTGQLLNGGIDVGDTVLAASEPFRVAFEPRKGDVSIDSDSGDWVYSAKPNDSGLDYFTIAVEPAAADVFTQVIAILVEPVDDPPTAADVFASIYKTDPGDPQALRVLLEGSDIDFDTLTYRIVTGPSNGTLTDPGALDAPVSAADLAGASVSYSPDIGFVGTDSFTYVVDDGTTESAVKTAAITVFDGFRQPFQQLGSGITGGETGRTNVLSADGKTWISTSEFSPTVYKLENGEWIRRGFQSFSEDLGITVTGPYRLSADGNTLVTLSFTIPRKPVVLRSTTDPESGTVTFTQLGSVPFEPDPYLTSVSSSANGNVIAVGSLGGSGETNPITGFSFGFVRVYAFDGSNWTQQGSDINGQEKFSGFGRRFVLSSDGQTLAIAAPGQLQDVAGRVRIFDYDGNDWRQRGSAIEGSATYYFGGETQGGLDASLALSSDAQTVAIVANERSGDKNGYASVYDYNGEAWIQRGDDLPSSGVNRITSLALSGDGNAIVLGTAEANQGTGIVESYRWIPRAPLGLWVRTGFIEGNNFDNRLGYSLALSSDGLLAAIGASGLTANGGTSAVYELTQSSPSVITGDTSGNVVEDGSSISGTLTATDPEGLATAPFSIATQPANGSASITGGAWVYTAYPNFAGTDTFTVAVRDSNDDETYAVITVEVSPINDAPTAVDVFAATPKSTAQSAQSVQVVFEGADIDFDALTYVVSSTPAHGTVSAVSGQGVIYTPDTGFSGSDSFTYYVSDNSERSADRTAHITVFNTYREDQRQLGDDIVGDAQFGLRVGETVVLSGDGRTMFTNALNTVQVYHFDGGSTWVRGADIDTGELVASISVSSDGLTIATGAVIQSVSSDCSTGNVRVYQSADGNWTQIGSVVTGLPVFCFADYQGTVVSLSSDGQVLAVGKPIEGRLSVYRFDGSDWRALGNDLTGSGQRFGASVALASDGLTLIVGAPLALGGNGGSGIAEVYRYRSQENVWSRSFLLGGVSSQQRNVGFAVAISSDGNTAAIADTRGVRIFDYNGASWTQRGETIFSIPFSRASLALASNGQTIVIGNQGGNLGPGQVAVYDYNGSDWMQRGADIVGQPGEFAARVAVSSDAQTLAIGATGFGDNGNVRIYGLTNQASDFTGSVAGTGFEDGPAITGEFRVSDPDGSGGFAIAAAPASGVASVSGVGALGNWSYTANDNFNGTDEFVIEVTDGLGAVSPLTISVTVTPVEDMLMISGTPDTTAIVGRPYAFVPNAEASNSTITGFTVTGKPSWMSFDSGTGALSGTPSAEDLGVTPSIVITVSDNSGLVASLNAFQLTTDFDSDNDGVINARDACNNTPASETAQVNNGGCGPSERDSDGDGVNDNLDAFPNNPNETTDSDGDGYGDNEEAEAGTDPNDADDQPVQAGLPIWLLYEATK